MNALLVPIRLDALFAEHEMMGVEARADFTKLPFNDGIEDVNSEFAYLSENFISHPFHDKNFLIRPGFHLHWALPDALTNARVKLANDGETKKITHPLAPDRWLIRRPELKYNAGKIPAYGWGGILQLVQR